MLEKLEEEGFQVPTFLWKISRAKHPGCLPN